MLLQRYNGGVFRLYRYNYAVISITYIAIILDIRCLSYLLIVHTIMCVHVHTFYLYESNEVEVL